MITYWPSPAKLNLFLYITGKRKDGYHALQTLFQFLDYGDTISIKLRRNSKFNLSTSFSKLAIKNNLIFRAANLLIQEVKRTHCSPVNNGIDIHIEKKIPMGSGLGGGSSNAATVLVALNQLWRCGLTEDELVILGLKLGADVPLFIRGYSAFAEGIGDVLSPVKPEEKWYLVAYPKVNISTSMMFKKINIFHNSKKRSIETLLKCKFSNVFEVIARKLFHEVDDAMCWMLKYTTSRLTGTGSCIFGEFHSQSAAYKVAEKSPEWIHSFVAKGINISPLKQICLKH